MPARQAGRMAVRGPTGLTYWRLHDKQQVDVCCGYPLQDDLIRLTPAASPTIWGGRTS